MARLGLLDHVFEDSLRADPDHLTASDDDPLAASLCDEPVKLLRKAVMI